MASVTNRRRTLAASAGATVLGLLAMLQAAPAAAQSAGSDSVLGRPRPGYDAMGIDLFAGPKDPGSPFILYPTLDVSGGWDDNVFRDEDNVEDDFFIKVSPAIALVSDWVNHGLSLSARADIARWERFDRNDATSFDVAGDGFLDVGVESQIVGGASFGRIADPRDDVNNPSSTDLVHSWQNEQYLGFSTNFGDFIWNTRGTRQRTNYIDNGANQDDRDYTMYLVSQRLGYEFQPGVVLFVDGSYNWRRYDDNVDDFGYERDSQGWQVRGGFSYDAAGVVAAEVSAGYLRQTYEDDRFGVASGFAVDGNILWNPGDLVTIRAYAGTQVSETSLEGASGAYTTHGGLGFDYDLADNLIFTSDAVFTNVDYDPVPGFVERKDDIWQASAGLIFLINEYFSLRADYTFTLRDSNLSGQDFRDNTVFLTLHSQL